MIRPFITTLCKKLDFEMSGIRLHCICLQEDTHMRIEDLNMSEYGMSHQHTRCSLSNKPISIHNVDRSPIHIVARLRASSQYVSYRWIPNSGPVRGCSKLHGSRRRSDRLGQSSEWRSRPSNAAHNQCDFGADRFFLILCMFILLLKL